MYVTSEHVSALTIGSLVATRSDPTIGMPDGEVWVSELEKRLKATSLSGQNPLLGKRYARQILVLCYRADICRDFIEDPEDDIDRYLDLAQNVLLTDHEASRGTFIHH